MNKSKEQNFISAILYIRNNADILKNTLETLIKVLDENFVKFEIICVDDSSTDNSTDIVRNIAKEHNAAITLITTGFYNGLERSMTAGIDAAIGDFVFEFDTAYITFEPSVIMDVYWHCLEGFDIVSASNQMVRTTSKIFYSWFNKFSKTQYALVSEDFRIISRRAINRIHQMSKVVPYRKAMYANCGLKIDNIQYKSKTNSTNYKHEKENKSFRTKLAIDAFILFTDVAYKFSFGLSMIMLLMSLFAIIYTITIFIMGSPVIGWTTTMLLMSVGFFGIFAILTLIIKYLSMILNLVFEKRKYIIENIEKL